MAPLSPSPPSPLLPSLLWGMPWGSRGGAGAPGVGTAAGIPSRGHIDIGSISSRADEGVDDAACWERKTSRRHHRRPAPEADAAQENWRSLLHLLVILFNFSMVNFH